MIFSQPAARHQTEQYIYQRRNQDQLNDVLKTKLKQEFYEKEFAKFENKGQVVAKQKYVNKRLYELRQQSKMELNQRRAKLARLLNSEHQQHKEEIKGLEETPEQVREKMIQRVKELKDEKEQIRKVYVDQQLERRFLKNADELRKVDQEYNELKALQERNIQIMEKQKLLEDKYQEEMIYAQLYKRDIKKKEREDARKLKEQREKLEERNGILAIQLQMNEQKRKQLENENNDEKQMLNYEWDQEKQRHEQQMEEQKQFLKTLNQNILETNNDQQEQKHQQKVVEKQQDKELIDNIVQKEKMLEFLENEQKKKAQQETINFMKNQAARNNEAEVFEKIAEELIAKEAEKQYQRQKAKWDKEEEARIKLMYQVYEDREKAVNQKQSYKEVEKEQKEVEKDILNKAVQEYEEEIEKKRVQEYEMNKTHQRNILGQVGDKEEQRRQQIRQKQQEEYEEQQRNREYEERIQQQKNKGRLLLDELRKQRPF